MINVECLTKWQENGMNVYLKGGLKLRSQAIATNKIAKVKWHEKIASGASKLSEEVVWKQKKLRFLGIGSQQSQGFHVIDEI